MLGPPRPAGSWASVSLRVPLVTSCFFHPLSHQASDEDERASVGSRGSLRVSTLATGSAWAGARRELAALRPCVHTPSPWSHAACGRHLTDACLRPSQVVGQLLADVARSCTGVGAPDCLSRVGVVMVLRICSRRKPLHQVVSDAGGARGSVKAPSVDHSLSAYMCTTLIRISGEVT